MSSKKEAMDAKEDGKPARVPKLRFPEFRDEAGWEQRLIGPYLVDCSGRVPPETTLPVYSSTREGLKRQDAYFDGRVLQNKNEYGVVPPGCLVYRHMSDDGLFKFNINETGGDIAVSKEYPVFSTRGLDAAFLLAKLNDGPDFKQFALSQKAGGTRTRLYFSRLSEWETLLPSPAEQNRIAECLSSVEEVIAAQARKVDALKIHKRGLMLQLFPREGETQPRLRFPEFKTGGEWEESTVDEVIFTVAPPKKLQTTDYKEYGRFPIVDQSQNYICGWTDDVDAVIGKELPVIVFGDHTCTFKYIDRPFVQGADGIKILRPKRGIDTNFLFCALEANPVVQESYKRHFSMLKEKKIHFPDQASGEQQRTVSCLSGLDALIAAEMQKLQALTRHKRGLMQQLFPFPEVAEA